MCSQAFRSPIVATHPHPFPVSVVRDARPPAHPTCATAQHPRAVLHGFSGAHALATGAPLTTESFPWVLLDCLLSFLSLTWRGGWAPSTHTHTFHSQTGEFGSRPQGWKVGSAKGASSGWRGWTHRVGGKTPVAGHTRLRHRQPPSPSAANGVVWGTRPLLPRQARDACMAPTSVLRKGGVCFLSRRWRGRADGGGRPGGYGTLSRPTAKPVLRSSADREILIEYAQERAKQRRDPLGHGPKHFACGHAPSEVGGSPPAQPARCAFAWPYAILYVPTTVRALSVLPACHPPACLYAPPPPLSSPADPGPPTTTASFFSPQVGVSWRLAIGQAKNS